MGDAIHEETVPDLQPFGDKLIAPTFADFFGIASHSVHQKSETPGKIIGRWISHIFLLSKDVMIKLRCHVDSGALEALRQAKQVKVRSDEPIDEMVVNEFLNVLGGLLRRVLVANEISTSQSLPFRTSGIFQLHKTNSSNSSTHLFWEVEWEGLTITVESEVRSRDSVGLSWDLVEPKYEIL